MSLAGIEEVDMRLALLIGFFLGICCSSQAAERSIVVTAALSAQPDAWVEEGRFTGVGMMLMESIFSELDIPVISKIQPWARSLKELEHGAVRCQFNTVLHR